MTNIWLAIYGIFVLGISFNSLFFTLLKKKTNYKGNTQSDTDMGYIIWLGFIFGPILFLFTKQIRIYRKHRYLRNRIQYYKWTNNPIDLNGFRNGVMNNEIQRMERILKISLIHQQTKRNKLKKRLLLR